MNGEAARALPPFRDAEDAMSSLSARAISLQWASGRMPRCSYLVSRTTGRLRANCASLPADAISQMSGRIWSTLPLAMIAELTTSIARVRLTAD